MTTRVTEGARRESPRFSRLAASPLNARTRVHSPYYCSQSNKQNNSFALASHVYCAFLWVSLHDFDVKMSIFTFYGGSKQATTKFFFLFVNFDIFPRDSAPVTFSYVSEIKWVGIISMEIERKRIHSATFSLPSPSSDLKVPILV